MPKKYYFISLLVLSTWISALPAVSFDCKQASSYVEKEICADNNPYPHSLSWLDDELNKAYQSILLRSINPEIIKREQRKWLKSRNKCESIQCIKGAYRNRLNSLHRSIRWPMKMVPSYGRTVESNIFPNEDTKLSILRTMISRNQIRFGLNTADKYCTKLAEDLGDKYRVKAIEPDIKTLSAYDPALSKLRKCDDKDPEDVNADPKIFYGGIGTLGQPPYRFYKINIDKKELNGKEDVLYHERGKSFSVPGAIVGRTGYTWIDLNNCIVKEEIGNVGEAWQKNTYKNIVSKIYRFNLIAKYHNEYLVIFVNPSLDKQENTTYQLLATRFNNQQPRLCYWK